MFETINIRENAGKIGLSDAITDSIDKLESNVRIISQQCDINSELSIKNSKAINQASSKFLRMIILLLIINLILAGWITILSVKFHHIDQEFGQVLIDIADDEAYIEDLELKLDREINK